MKKDKGGNGSPRKKGRAFDFSKCCSRQIALQISYVGWDFQGFAAQDDTDNTIEGHLFAALTKTCLVQSRATSHYSRCARTDKGVSALGQVVSVRVRSKLGSGLGVFPPKKDSADGDGGTAGGDTAGDGDEDEAAAGEFIEGGRSNTGSTGWRGQRTLA